MVLVSTLTQAGIISEPAPTTIARTSEPNRFTLQDIETSFLVSLTPRAQIERGSADRYRELHLIGAPASLEE
jgi:hypothetical protein